MSSEAVMELVGNQGNEVIGMLQQISDKDRFSNEQRLEIREKLVGELLSHKWTSDYLKELQASKNGFVDLTEQIRGRQSTKGMSIRQEIAGLWNGIIGEAVVRKLWEQATGAPMGSDTEMDKSQKTDAMGRVHIEGRGEYAYLIQTKASSSLHVGEVLFVYPKLAKQIPLITPSDDEYDPADYNEILEKIDPGSTDRNKLAEVAVGAKYKQLQIVDTIPLMVVIGTGRDWMGLMELVEEGEMTEVFREGLGEGLTTKPKQT